MNNRIAADAAAWALSKVGCPYSQEKRNQDGVFDCSSLVARAYAAQGKRWRYGGSVRAAIRRSTTTILNCSGRRSIRRLERSSAARTCSNARISRRSSVSLHGFRHKPLKSNHPCGDGRGRKEHRPRPRKGIRRVCKSHFALRRKGLRGRAVQSGGNASRGYEGLANAGLAAEAERAGRKSGNGRRVRQYDRPAR